MNELRVGIAGLGVVGGGLLRILINGEDRVARTGVRLIVTGVSARDRKRERAVPLDNIAWFDDPVQLAKSDDIDVFVELVGGANGTAKFAVEAAIMAGKHVITANKALIAEHGAPLARLAEGRNVTLLYEAAVAGGIPAIRAIRDGLGLCDISRVTGILNGTCNYILSEMARKGIPYSAALSEAQHLGYAEADPELDVNGMDAAHKLAILAMIAFDTAIDFAAINVEGISNVTAEDIQAADALGYGVKLLAIARNSDESLELRVHTALVAKGHDLANAEGPGNVLRIQADPLGEIGLTGPGAGAGPTAAAVAADLLSLARGAQGPVFNTPARRLRTMSYTKIEDQCTRVFLKVPLKNVPGAVAGVTDILAGQHVSIDGLWQPTIGEEDSQDASHSLVLVTHKARLADIHAAIRAIAELPFCQATPSVIRIEDF